MPLAVSATTFRGLRLSRWTNERTWAANSSSMSTVLDTDVVRGPRDATVRGAPSARARLRHGAPLGKTRVATDRSSPGKTELDPVVGGRVVRRRQHRPGEVELARGEVEEVGRGEADVDHAEADRDDARAERDG